MCVCVCLCLLLLDQECSEAFTAETDIACRQHQNDNRGRHEYLSILFNSVVAVISDRLGKRLDWFKAPHPTAPKQRQRFTARAAALAPFVGVQRSAKRLPAVCILAGSAFISASFSSHGFFFYQHDDVDVGRYCPHLETCSDHVVSCSRSITVAGGYTQITGSTCTTFCLWIHKRTRANTESLHGVLIALWFCAKQVSQKSSALCDDMLQASFRPHVFPMESQVSGQVRYASGQNSDLHLGRARVEFVSLKGSHCNALPPGLELFPCGELREQCRLHRFWQRVVNVSRYADELRSYWERLWRCSDRRSFCGNVLRPARCSRLAVAAAADATAVGVSRLSCKRPQGWT